MKVIVEQGEIQSASADAIVVNLFEGVTQPGGATGAVDQALNGAIRDLIATGDFEGDLGEVATLYSRGALSAQRVLVVGLGEADKFNQEGVREASGAVGKRAEQLNIKTLATIVHGGGIGGLDVTEAAQAVAEGSLLALYKYDAPKSKEDEVSPPEQLTLVEFDESKIEQVEAGAQAGQAIAEGVYLARTLANQPSNVATPTGMAEAARTMCEEVGLACRILDEDDIHAENMGLLLSVTQGSTEPAKFIIMEHKPSDAKNDGPVVLVGKGITFDTGGYSLKPKGGMVGMKGDMSGAASVIGAMNAVGRLNLPLHVVGLVPAVENMVSATAYKPNDVFIGKNGVSVEIISTDAEGRLILADALCYADSLNPSAVIDVATLTGAKLIALGRHYTGLFVSDDDLHDALTAAGKRAGEPLWRMPLDTVYDRQLKTQVADLKNTGGSPGGAVTAARFLAHFVGDWPWAHIDIAGSHLYSEGPEYTPRSYLTPGATGNPMRALVEYLRSL